MRIQDRPKDLWWDLEKGGRDWQVIRAWTNPESDRWKGFLHGLFWSLCSGLLLICLGHIPKVHSLAGMPRVHQGALCLSLAGQRVG